MINTIGGDDPLLRNVIAANLYDGVWIDGAGSDRNALKNNWIGVNWCDVTPGPSPVPWPEPNGGWGVRISAGAKSTVIGAASSTAYSNTISGNTLGGVLVEGSGTSGTQVVRNRIGVHPTGWTITTVLPFKSFANGGPGVKVAGKATAVTIGGDSGGYGNQISNNQGEGVLVTDAGTSNVSICANIIGLGPALKAVCPNSLHGVKVDNASGVTIGTGTFAGANLISGNLLDGVLIQGTGATGCKVQGNLIGTDGVGDPQFDVSKHNKLANGGVGVRLYAGAHGNLINLLNVIAGNQGSGIVISGPKTDGNTVSGNIVGLNRAKTIFVPNSPDTASAGVAILVRSDPSASGTLGPAKTAVVNNWIYGTQRCINFIDCTDVATHSLLPTGNRAVGNHLGMLGDGTRGKGDVGIFVNHCAAFLKGNEIAGQNTGIEVLGIGGICRGDHL